MRSRISRRRAWAVAGLILGFCAIAYAILARDSPEEKVRKTLHRLEQVASFDEPGGNVLVLTGELNQRFKQVFVENVRVTIPELESLHSGRQKLAAVAARTRQGYDSFELRLTQDRLELFEERHAATVQATARLEALRGQRVRRDVRSVRFELEERDGDWLIESVVVSPKDPDAAGL